MRAGLDRETIVRAALDLVDREGADALSMRRLAESIGAKPMSLYSHFSGKDDVIDAMYELILGEVVLPRIEDLPWQEWVRAGWGSYRDALRRHPLAFSTVARRPTNTRSGRYALVTNVAIGVFRAAGFSADASFHAHRMMTAFVLGMVHAEVTWVARDSGGQGGAIAVPPGDYPYFAEALPHLVKPDFNATFEFGLGLLIGALEDLLEREGD